MRPMLDVAVIGGGPAGLATALRLHQLGRSVSVLERSAYARRRLGEHLSAEGEEALHRLGVGEVLEHGAHLASPGVLSAWGSEKAVEFPAIFRPAGAGRHLDRPRFEQALARELERRGGEVHRNRSVVGVQMKPGGWRLEVEGSGEPNRVEAHLLVDATGRSAWLARRLGARTVRRDALVGLAAEVAGPPSLPMPLVEAVELGWWYSAPLPGGKLVAIFFTDGDLMPADDLATSWRSALAHAPLTRARVGENDVVPRGLPAHSQCLEPVWASGWIAVGDAALAMDPLASAGLAHGLGSGMDAADAAHALLAGDEGPVRRYGNELVRLFHIYREARRRHYRWERRWPRSPFWRRRQHRAAEENAVWLPANALLTLQTDETTLASSLRGVTPDLGGAAVARLARRPIAACDLATRLREKSGYEDVEIIDALQVLVADGCLKAES